MRYVTPKIRIFQRASVAAAGMFLLSISVINPLAAQVAAEEVPARGTYKDSSLPIDDRVEDLIGRMNLQEKVGQLNQTLYGWETYKRDGDEITLTNVLLDEAKHWGGIGAIYGMLRADPWSGVTWESGITPEMRPKFLNQVQRAVMDHSRWRIPVLFSTETSHGYMTLGEAVLPTAIGMGSSWNIDLYQETVRSIAKEVRLSGEHFAMVSCLDVGREPRWGRIEECFSEDGYLVSRFARAVTIGAQGENPSVELSRPDRAAVVLKHLAGQGASSGGRNAAASNLGPREFNEIHMPPARAGALAGARSFMVAYNEVDGIPCSTNPELLKTILRDTYGFNGVMMADGTALDILRNQTGTYEEAGIRAARAGVDLSLWDNAFRTLADSVRAGKLEESVIDGALANVLRLKFEMGLFENPFVDENFAPLSEAIENTKRLNLELARESLVLLKNDAGLLPLSRDVKRVAVIGPNADNGYAQTGDYTPPQRPGDITTILSGMREFLGDDVEVNYALGCSHRGMDTSGFDEAVELAESSDIVIVAVGGSSNRFVGTKYSNTGAADIEGMDKKEMDTGEGVDLADLSLGGVQLELVKALRKTGKEVVVVFVQGRPYAAPWIYENCSTILNAWYPGSRGGYAIAETLFGEVNPSGRLSVSIPRSSAQLPVFYNYKFRGARLYYDVSSLPQYRFGYGMSYTDFEFTNFRISDSEMSAEELNNGQSITVSVDVTNVGDRTGKETVQLYLRGVTSEISRRIRELKAFEKIELKPNETRKVTFEIGKEELAVWGRDMEFDVGIGLNELYVKGGDTEELVVELNVN